MLLPLTLKHPHKRIILMLQFLGLLLCQDKSVAAPAATLCLQHTMPCRGNSSCCTTRCCTPGCASGLVALLMPLRDAGLWFVAARLGRMRGREVGAAVLAVWRSPGRTEDRE
jgi:hypothetical protein